MQEPDIMSMADGECITTLWHNFLLGSLYDYRNDNICDLRLCRVTKLPSHLNSLHLNPSIRHFDVRHSEQRYIYIYIYIYTSIHTLPKIIILRVPQE